MIREKPYEPFRWYQFESGYPEGPSSPPPCHLEKAATWGDLPLQANRALLIGPGTSIEVAQLKLHCAIHELTILTGCAFEFGGQHTGDIHDPRLASEQFDLIFSSNVAEHWFAPYIALMQCRRLLRPGGVFYAIVPTFDAAGGGHTPWHISCFPRDVWIELLHKTGFSGTVRETTEPTVGPNERYFHMRAEACTPAAPHDVVLTRLLEAYHE